MLSKLKNYNTGQVKHIKAKGVKLKKQYYLQVVCIVSLTLLTADYLCNRFVMNSGADKSRFWPNRALWGTSMKLGTLMV